ncbi:MAG TPA: winged helix-turn-helix domain-containing protein [Dehalococcoidia bacterium]
MASVVLAIGDGALRRLCEAELRRAGHTAVAVTRALEVLQLARRVMPDVVLVDETPLGRDVAKAASGSAVAGLGLQDAALKGSLALPATGRQVVDLVERLAGPALANGAAMRLDAGRRVISANGREVGLTPTEFRILEAAYSCRGHEISQDAALEAAWGPGDWSGNVGVLRAHVRNLRMKLAQVGLPNAVRSVRGKGYALVV